MDVATLGGNCLTVGVCARVWACTIIIVSILGCRQLFGFKLFSHTF